jgi:hypothetical protein
MGADALGQKIVALSATIALAAGCSRPPETARDASGVRASADGSAEAQAIDPPATATPVTAGTDGSEGGRDPHRMRRVLGWVSLSIGAEAAVVAVATSLLIEHPKSVRDRDCNAQKVCGADGFDAVGTIDTIVPWNTASWFIAAAGLGAGTVLLILSPSPNERSTAVTLSPLPSGVGLGVRSAF